MTASDITSILTAATGITALITSAITSICSIKSQERMKNAEMYYPRAYDALSDMSKAYSRLLRGESLPDTEDERQPFYDKAASAYYEFTGSAYTVMALISDQAIQSQIAELIMEIQNFSYFPNVLHDQQFCKIMNNITRHIRKSRKKHRAQCNT